MKKFDLDVIKYLKSKLNCSVGGLGFVLNFRGLSVIIQ